MNNVDGPDDPRGFFDHAKYKERHKVLNHQDLDTYIRGVLNKYRQDIPKNEVDGVVNLIKNLKFMQSPEAIEAFIKACKLRIL